MGISRHAPAAVAAVAAGLAAALALSGCSRAVEAAPKVQVRSELPGVALVALSDLPQSPESGAVDEYCAGYRAKTLSPTGRQVEALGWKVTSEAALGRYRVVTFASGFDPGTSAVCTARNANIGVFDGARLIALAFSPGGSETILGSVEPLESGALMVWGGDYPGPPLGELRAEGDRLRLTAVASERTFCGRTATVPNVYGRPIHAARTTLIAHGWQPLPPEGEEAEYSGAERLVREGVIEAEACSGTGMGYCAFKYRGPGGVLGVTTAGDSDRVVAYGVTCPGEEPG